MAGSLYTFLTSRFTVTSALIIFNIVNMYRKIKIPERSSLVSVCANEYEELMNSMKKGLQDNVGSMRDIYWMVTAISGTLLVFHSYFPKILHLLNVCRMIFPWVISTNCINEFEDGKRDIRFDDADIYFKSIDTGTANFKDPIRRLRGFVLRGTSMASKWVLYYELGVLMLLLGLDSRIDMSFENKPVAWISRSIRIDDHQQIRSYRITSLTYYGHSFKRRYLKYVKKEAKRLGIDRKLYTNRSDDVDGGSAIWSSRTSICPPSFEDLAIDPELRDSVTADLSRFLKRRDYYAKMGKEWNRKYLICGPSGSGKASFVGAISNFLNFDIYDLDLNAVRSKAQLDKLLTSTTPNSILVVENIDPNIIARQSRAVAISLSDVVNITDRPWISCFSKRLIIFTANNLEGNPAILQPGKMDVLIDLGYCRSPEIRFLAAKYIGV